jgi:2-enoate reductase
MTPVAEDFVSHLLEHMGDWFDDDRQLQTTSQRKDLFPYTHLFSPIRINRLQVKNRIVMGPMANNGMADEYGRPSEKMIRYFVERARGGVGLITSGIVPISDASDPTVTERDHSTYFPRLSGSRALFSGWRDVAAGIHAHGAHFFVQLSAGMGRVGDPEVLLTKHRLPVSASWNPNFYIPAIPCRPLTDRECRRIVKAAGQAAADAKALNIDGVYLHGHEGYLLEQMTNPAFNRRTLGHFSDWPVFGLEMVREMRKRVGADYPIMYRIDLSLALNATYGERMETVGSLKKFRRERQVGETLDYMARLVEEGVDLFDVDLGCYENWWLPHPPNSIPSGAFLPVARLVKQFFAEHEIRSRAGLPVPVVAVGKLGYPDLAEKALRDGQCDMVMLARPLLADPQWPNKAYAGRVDEICPCIGDQEACLNELVEGGHMKCSVNPRAGFEDALGDEVTPAPAPHRIGVVGAGPGGIQAAIAASRRGHHVTLYDAHQRLGGWLIAGSVPKTKYEIANYVSYLEGQVQRCCADHSLSLRLGQTVTPEALRQERFDALVLCSGARPVTPDVPGTELPHVVQAVDLLLDPERALGADDIVVVGGGAVGCEVAHWLAAEHGKRVTVIERLPYMMKGLCTANRGHLIHELERRGARLLNCTRLQAIRPGEVTIARNRSATVPDPYVTWAPILPENVPNPLAKAIVEDVVEETLPADLLVLAAGLRPDHSLFEGCKELHAADEIVAIGDSFHVGQVFQAVHAGFGVGRSL